MMKIQKIPSLCVFTFVVASIAPIAYSSESSTHKFRCDLSQKVPSTVAQTSRGDVQVVQWTSEYFTDSGFSPETRCQKVSERFQTYYEDGRLNFLTTGTLNQIPVVCVAKYKGSGCNGLLFTLKPGDDPDETLKRLLRVRDRASGPINQSSSSKIYIDMNRLLETAPTKASDNASESPTSVPSDDTTNHDLPLPKAW